MYEYGFNNYPISTLCTEGSCFTTVSVDGAGVSVPVYCTSTLSYLVLEGEKVERTIYLNSSFPAPPECGSIVGRGRTIRWTERVLEPPT